MELATAKDQYKTTTIVCCQIEKPETYFKMRLILKSDERDRAVIATNLLEIQFIVL